MKCSDPENNSISVFWISHSGKFLLTIWLRIHKLPRLEFGEQDTQSSCPGTMLLPECSHWPRVCDSKFPAGGKTLILLDSMVYIWSILILKSFSPIFSLLLLVQWQKHPTSSQGLFLSLYPSSPILLELVPWVLLSSFKFTSISTFDLTNMLSSLWNRQPLKLPIPLKYHLN